MHGQHVQRLAPSRGYWQYARDRAPGGGASRRPHNTLLRLFPIPSIEYKRELSNVRLFAAFEPAIGQYGHIQPIDTAVIVDVTPCIRGEGHGDGGV